MLKFTLNFLLIITLSTTLLSFFLHPIEVAAGQAALGPVSPISPLQPGDDQQEGDSGDSNNDGNDEAEKDFAGLKPSVYVWLPQTPLGEMWVKTHQIGLGWWDSQGELHIALQRDGVIKIDLTGVTMISIPLDAAGFNIPAGWQKIKRPQNGEWVIIPNE